MCLQYCKKYVEKISKEQRAAQLFILLLFWNMSANTNKCQEQTYNFKWNKWFLKNFASF